MTSLYLTIPATLAIAILTFAAALAGLAAVPYIEEVAFNIPWDGGVVLLVVTLWAGISLLAD